MGVDIEKEQALKEWAMAQMKANYDDFERLLTAKNNELKALIAANKGHDVDFSQFAL